MADLDLLLRAATVALAFSAALSIAMRRNRGTAAPYAAFAVAGIGAFMIASAPGAHSALGLAAFFFNAWCLATPGVVWLLARSLFREGGRHNAAHILAIGALVCVTMAGDYGRYALGPLAAYPDEARMLLLAGRGAALALLFVGVRHGGDALARRPGGAKAPGARCVRRRGGSGLRRARGSEFLFRRAWRAAGRAARRPHLLLALSFVLAPGACPRRPRGAASMLRPRRVPRRRSRWCDADGLDAAIARRVVRGDGRSQALEARRPRHRGARSRAGHAGVPVAPRHQPPPGLPQLQRFPARLPPEGGGGAPCRSRTSAHLPVLTIALDCGYGSIGPFNRAFKARYGITPGQFRNQRALTRDSASREHAP